MLMAISTPEHAQVHPRIMPILTYAEAARLAGVDRSTIKRKAKRGELSESTRSDGTRGIEASELARLYPHIHAQAERQGMPQQPHHGTPGHTAAESLGTYPQALGYAQAATLEALQREVELLRQQLQQALHREQTAQEREQWLQQQVEALQQRLLPAPRQGLVDRLGHLIERLRYPGRSA